MTDGLQTMHRRFLLIVFSVVDLTILFTMQISHLTANPIYLLSDSDKTGAG